MASRKATSTLLHPRGQLPSQRNQSVALAVPPQDSLTERMDQDSLHKAVLETAFSSSSSSSLSPRGVTGQQRYSCERNPVASFPQPVQCVSSHDRPQSGSQSAFASSPSSAAFTNHNSILNNGLAVVGEGSARAALRQVSLPLVGSERDGEKEDQERHSRSNSTEKGDVAESAAEETGGLARKSLRLPRRTSSERGIGGGGGGGSADRVVI